VVLEAAQLVAGDAVAAGIVGRQVGLGLGAQPQRPADALDVDPEHPRTLAPSEGRDGQPREVPHGRVGAVAEGRGDLPAQLVEVELQRLPALTRGRLGDLPPGRLGLGGAEEEALEHELEGMAVVGGLGQRGGERLLEVRLERPADLGQRGESVEQLGGADGHPLLAQLLGEGQQLTVEATGTAIGDLGVDAALRILGRGGHRRGRDRARPPVGRRRRRRA
jgi:hypothetical protein